jgi:hypothetical protein
MDLAYPIGHFTKPATVTADERVQYLDILAAAPAHFRRAVDGLNDEQLDTPYRPGGWTVRQVIHHIPDSHMISVGRCKMALTEENPAVKPYPEAKWAELTDGRTGPVGPSLQILEGLHARWVALLTGLSEEEWKRTFHHADLGAMRLDQTLALYAWHSRHHAAHINNLRARMGWK